jgi:hypothetical protein
MRGRGARRDIGTGAETGVEQVARAQPGERRFVDGEPGRLAQYRPVPAQPEPREILLDRRDEALAAARAVDILDTQQEAAARRPRVIVRLERGIGMAEVQPPGRARRETGAHAAHARTPPQKA